MVSPRIVRELKKPAVALEKPAEELHETSGRYILKMKSLWVFLQGIERIYPRLEDQTFNKRDLMSLDDNIPEIIRLHKKSISISKKMRAIIKSILR